MKKTSRLLSILLAASLLNGLIPLSAVAAGPQPQVQQEASQVPEVPQPEAGKSQDLSASQAPVLQQITGVTITAEPKVYDGLTDNPVLSVTFTGPDTQPGAEDYQITGVYDSFHITKDDSPNLTVTLALTQAGLQKYAVSPDLPAQHRIHGAITPARLTVTALDQSLPAGGSPDLSSQKVTATVTTGETVTLQSVTLEVQGESLVPSEAAVKVEKGTRDTTGNYTIHYVNGRLSHQIAAVTAAPAAVTGLTYNGENQTLVTAGQAQNGQMEYYVNKKGSADALSQEPQWSRDLPQAMDAGTYVVHYRAKGEPGYADSPEATLEVTLGQRAVVLSATAEKVYDGTGSVPQKADGYDDLKNIALVSGSFLEADVQVLGVKGSTFKEGHYGAGSSRSVIPGNIHLSGSGANYLVTMQITGTISPRPVTVTLGGKKAYGQKDPEISYTAQGLLKGDSLQGQVTREPGEKPGAYAYDGSALSNPNYQVTVTPGKLTIEAARAELTLKLSAASQYPGKAVTLTVTARNGEKNLMDSGFDQPQSLQLLLGREALKLHRDKKDPTLYTAEYKLPKDSKGSLTFTLKSGEDGGNYMAASAKQTLEIKKESVTPQTGDRMNLRLYVGLTIGSGLALVGVTAGMLLYKKKH